MTPIYKRQIRTDPETWGVFNGLCRLRHLHQRDLFAQLVAAEMARFVAEQVTAGCAEKGDTDA